MRRGRDGMFARSLEKKRFFALSFPCSFLGSSPWMSRKVREIVCPLCYKQIYCAKRLVLVETTVDEHRD